MAARHFKTTGNLIYPDGYILTWGGFYYHSFDKAKAKKDSLIEDIVTWCNLEDPTLNIKAENIFYVGDTQVIFEIKAWKDEDTLEDCRGFIEVEEIIFED